LVADEERQLGRDLKSIDAALVIRRAFHSVERGTSIASESTNSCSVTATEGERPIGSLRISGSSRGP
jgi:hypothetical protein